MSLLPVGISGEAGAYQIERSLRFNSSDSAYMNRTPASAGNRQTFTYSFWVKRSALAAGQAIFEAGTGASNYSLLWFNSSDQLSASEDQGAGGVYTVTTTQVFRDVSSWYHIVVAFDTTQATSTNRIKFYVNGVQVTAFGTASYPSQNLNTYVNATNAHNIGRRVQGSAYLNGYLTEINFIDGSALTPSSFGETNPTTGVWQPKKYTGSYGTNGFYLNFSDNASTTTLGDDFSGNNNDWTPNNFSVTAGAGNDSLVDSPTRYGSGSAGGDVRGNYATLNPLNQRGSNTFVNGNLDFTIAAVSENTITNTIAMSSGKWYWEVVPTTISNNAFSAGVVKTTISAASMSVFATGGIGYYSSNGNKYVNGSASAYGSSYTTNDVIGIALNCDSNEITFYKNNVSQGAISIDSGSTWYAAISNGTGTGTQVGNTNFGQRPFAYTAPSGFKALVTTNLPTPTILDGEDYFNAVLYTGTGSSLGVTGVGFQPDFVWIKERSGAADHGLYDVVRGVQNQLESNTTTAETTETTGLTAFGSDGFTVGALAQLNTNTDTYVAWNWKANGAGSSNTAGTITSTVSVNTTSGFSIVTYTGTGSAATVGHGLGAVPRMIIVKNRDQADAWQVYHAANTANPETDYLVLNTTAATADAADRWNDTLPTSTVFSIGNGVEVNTNTEDYVAYCFAPVAGYSAFGSYTGNGSTDGPFVYLGFRPAFILIRQTSAGDWVLMDTARNSYNILNRRLDANNSAAEVTLDLLDVTANGFKVRTTNGNLNTNGTTYIYAAFAENPTKFALAR